MAAPAGASQADIAGAVKAAEEWANVSRDAAIRSSAAADRVEAIARLGKAGEPPGMASPGLVQQPARSAV